jgi:hypothetical protein
MARHRRRRRSSTRSRRASPRRTRRGAARRSPARRRRAGTRARKHVHFVVRKGGRRRVVDFMAKRNGHTSARTRKKSPAFRRAQTVMKKAFTACAKKRHLRPFTKTFGKCVKQFFARNY